MLIHRKDRMKIIECLLYDNGYGILDMYLVGGWEECLKLINNLGSSTNC